ncbi:unnamed protein product [Phytophthora lilii]|uniref:Unnamed protein product n=1 Tax=Phytophthora lilii TaxID=2077276 RepID=A0A9W6YFA4_9STRA|nr:unnamed protein product [Phytophthora lilii]
MSNINASVLDLPMSSLLQEESVLACRYCKLGYTEVAGETLIGLRVFDFRRSTWLNDTCITLGLMFIKQRYPRIGIICPDFTAVPTPEKRKKRAGKLGAFENSNNPVSYVCAANVTPSHWAAFIFYPNGLHNTRSPKLLGTSANPKPACVMFDASRDHYDKLKFMTMELFDIAAETDVHFIGGSTPKHVDGSSCGVLSLLFVEMSLVDGSGWGEDAFKALAYYRLRYLRHALAMMSTAT